MIFIFLFSLFFSAAWGQQSISVHAQMTFNKGDDVGTHVKDAEKLLELAKKEKVSESMRLMVEKLIAQLKKVQTAQNTVAEQKEKQKATEFTAGKYKLKEMKKLRAKKTTIKTYTVKEFQEKFKSLDNWGTAKSEPFLVKGAGEMFQNFQRARELFNADSFASNPKTENVQNLEYWPPGKAKFKQVGNMIQMEEPTMITFAKYLTLCHLGSAAAPKIPGQATEHCEYKMSAKEMWPDAAGDLLSLKLEQRQGDGEPIVQNVFWDWEKASSKFFDNAAAKKEIKEVLGKTESRSFLKSEGSGNFRFFVFGPSGSGEKLHAEQGLPYYDVLVHGYRRWLLMKEDEIQRVAAKAKEALEFQETSAYMFFEEKLPELKEEFGLKAYKEANQEPGDIIFVPSHWFRVSLSLMDSISFYETLLYQPAVVSGIIRSSVWNPQMQQFNLGYCFNPDEVIMGTGGVGNPQTDQHIEKQFRELIGPAQRPLPILKVMATCNKMLYSYSKYPEVIDLDKSKCSYDVWRKCREQLVGVSKKLDHKAVYDWLPEDLEAEFKEPEPTNDESDKKIEELLAHSEKLQTEL